MPLRAIFMVISDNKKAPREARLSDAGGSGEIRTRDQRIKSPLLYRLSYRPGKTEIIARSLGAILRSVRSTPQAL